MVEQLISNYKPSKEVAELVRSTPIVLLVGITGAGKDTIKRALLQDGAFTNFISYTTRSPRSNQGVMEQDGVEYRFVSKDDMGDLLQKGEMIEAKQFSANVYGTGAADLREAQSTGKIAVNDIEVQGVREYKKISSNVHAMFILPPSYKEWQARLSSRYGNTDDLESDNMNLRMETAKEELKEALDAGYFTFVINDEIDRVVEEIKHRVNGEQVSREEEMGRALADELYRTLSTH